MNRELSYLYLMHLLKHRFKYYRLLNLLLEMSSSWPYDVIRTSILIGWFGGCAANPAVWSAPQGEVIPCGNTNVTLSVMTKTHLLGITPVPLLTTQHQRRDVAIYPFWVTQ